jgi:hypothetical protein
MRIYRINKISDCLKNRVCGLVIVDYGGVRTAVIYRPFDWATD